MKHEPSQDDLDYLRAFESYKIDASQFHHREHLQIAYTLLAQKSVDEAYQELKTHILGLLNHVGVGSDKYHDTMTYAWLLAVKHFMEISDLSDGFDMFIEMNAILLDQSIMYSHYSKDLLLSRQARVSFVQPDLEAIPVYGSV